MPDSNTDVYFVQLGDTLSTISQKTGKTVSQLMQLNSAKNIKNLTEGQALYLTEKAAFTVKVLFLDVFRCGIENLKYKLVHDGQEIIGSTARNGMAVELITKNAMSQVEIHIKNLSGQWQKLSSVVSDYGTKLVTLVSPAIVQKAHTEPHPPEAPLYPQSKPAAPAPAPSKQPSLPTPPTGAPTKNNPHAKAKKTKGKHGETIIKIGFEIPSDLLKTFALYKPDPITEDEWNVEANKVQCEAAVLKAIAMTESGGGNSYWRLNDSNGAFIPALLYERHYFKKLTKDAYSKDYPDISGPCFAKSGGYGSHEKSYLRFINAYRLDPEAAIKSCSWGKFQIMGNNYNNCIKNRTIYEFLDDMCKGESGQIHLLSGFINNNPELKKAAIEKDWAALAKNYNGPKYAENSYDKKLKEHYEQITKNA